MTPLPNALTAIETDYRAELSRLREVYTARMETEAWGDPAKAGAIGAEWATEREKALVNAKQRIAELKVVVTE